MCIYFCLYLCECDTVYPGEKPDCLVIFVHTLLEKRWMASSEGDIVPLYLWGVSLLMSAQILNILTEINMTSVNIKRDFFPSVALSVNGRLYCLFVCMCPWCSVRQLNVYHLGLCLNAWHLCNNHRRKVLKSNFWKGLHVFLWFQTSCLMVWRKLV